jgi:hypothetical protein
MKYMGRGRTHAVSTRALGNRSVDELENHIKEEVATRMNLGLEREELRDMGDMVDSHQVTRESDVTVMCKQKR